MGEAGFTPTNLDTAAKVNFEDGSITQITLSLNGAVPGIKLDQFKEIAQKAKEICPISKLLKTNIVLEVELEG